MVWRPAPDSPQSVGVFLRAMGGPGDRNLLNFSVNGGVTLKAPLPGRDNDAVGVGFGVAKISGARSASIRIPPSIRARPTPSARAESFIEVTYQYVVTPWLQVQPDFQYFSYRAGVCRTRTVPATESATKPYSACARTSSSDRCFARGSPALRSAGGA